MDDDTDEFYDCADSGDSDDEDLAEAYYEAKNKKTSGPEDAVDAFERVLTLELRDAKRTEWGFKALKQLLKLGAAKESTDLLRNYKRILSYHSAVSYCQMEKACMKALAFLTDVESFRKFGQTTNEAVKDTRPTLWSRVAMRLATTLFAGGHNDDAFPILAVVWNAVQGDARLSAVEDSLLLDVYKLKAEIFIRKRDFRQIEVLHRVAHYRRPHENPVALAVIKECFGVVLILESQYDRAEMELIAAAKTHHDECSQHTLRCCQLLAVNAALRTGPGNDRSGAPVLPQPSDSRVLAASELARPYQTEHGDAFLTAAQKFLAEDTDPLVACVLEQWTYKVRKVQAAVKRCLDYAIDERLPRNAMFHANNFACLRTQFAAEPDEFIRRLCVTRAWAAELQYWLQLGKEDRARDVVNEAPLDRLNCAWGVQDSSAALLREFCGRSFFEQGALDYAQRNLCAALRQCSADRVRGCTQLLVFVGLLLGEDDDLTHHKLEEDILDIVRQLAKHICTFEPADCARLLSDDDYLAGVDPFIVKTLQQWIAKMEPGKECLRAVELQLAFEEGDHSAAMQRVEELKEQTAQESNETVRLLCRMQLCAAELQIASVAGDHRRLRDVLAKVPSYAFICRKDKVVVDQSSAAAIIQEFVGRMKLTDGNEAGILSAFESAVQTYTYCGSENLVACKRLVLFCRLVQHAAGGHDFPATESVDEDLLELLVPLTAAIAKADFEGIRLRLRLIDAPPFSETAKHWLYDAVSQWLKMLENSNRILTEDGQKLVDSSDYSTLRRTLDDVTIPTEIFDTLTRDMWTLRLWSLKVQMSYHSKNKTIVDDIVERMEELSVNVQHSEPAGIVWEFSGKRYPRANDRPRALERFRQALQTSEINESSRRYAIAGYIALTESTALGPP